MKVATKQKLAIGVIAGFIGLFLWGLKADASEVRLGVGIGFAANAEARYQEIMLTSTDRKWYGAYTRIGGDAEHNYHYNRFTVGRRVNWRRATNFSPYMRFGIAYFNEPPKDYISESLSYDMALGVRLYDVLEIEFDQHNSTAGRSDDNEGLDAYMISVVFSF